MVHCLFNNSICVSISLKRITSHITASLKKSTHSHKHKHIHKMFILEITQSSILQNLSNNTKTGYFSQQQSCVPFIELKLYTQQRRAHTRTVDIFEHKIFVWKKNVGILMSCLKSLFLSFIAIEFANIADIYLHLTR